MIQRWRVDSTRRICLRSSDGPQSGSAGTCRRGDGNDYAVQDTRSAVRFISGAGRPIRVVTSREALTAHGCEPILISGEHTISDTDEQFLWLRPSRRQLPAVDNQQYPMTWRSADQIARKRADLLRDSQQNRHVPQALPRIHSPTVPGGTFVVMAQNSRSTGHGEAM